MQPSRFPPEINPKKKRKNQQGKIHSHQLEVDGSGRMLQLVISLFHQTSQPRPSIERCFGSFAWRGSPLLWSIWFGLGYVFLVFCAGELWLWKSEKRTWLENIERIKQIHFQASSRNSELIFNSKNQCNSCPCQRCSLQSSESGDRRLFCPTCHFYSLNLEKELCWEYAKPRIRGVQNKTRCRYLIHIIDVKAAHAAGFFP